MTTVAAIIVGLASGYFLGMSRTALTVTTVVMIILTAVQTWHLASGVGSFSNVSTVHTAGYWIVQVASIALALALTRVGAKVALKMRGNRTQPEAIRQSHI